MCSQCFRCPQVPTDIYPCVIIPVSKPGSPGAPAAPAAGSLLDVAAGLRDSSIGSRCLAQTMQLLSPLLIPLPDTVLLHTDPALLLELTQISHDDTQMTPGTTQAVLIVMYGIRPSVSTPEASGAPSQRRPPLMKGSTPGLTWSAGPPSTCAMRLHVDATPSSSKTSARRPSAIATQHIGHTGGP